MVPLAFYVISLINLMQVTAMNGIKPVVSLYASFLGHTPAEISIIIAAAALLPAMLALQLGKWIDRLGTRPLVACGNAMFIIALFISALYPHFLTFLLQQALIGIAFTAIMLALQKRIGSLGHDVDRAVANFSLFGSLGAMIGPVLSTFLYEHYGYQVCSYANLSLMMVAFAIEFLIKNPDLKQNPNYSRSSHASPQKQEPIWSMLRERDLRNAIIIGGLVLSNRELFSAYFPLLAEKLGVSPTMTGILISFSGLTMLLVRFSQTALVRSFGRMNVLTWSLYVSGLIYILTPFSGWIAVLFILVGILGGGLGLGQPLSISSVLEISPPDRRGEVLGVRITVNRVSQFALPLLFGGLGGLAGVSAIFWASGLVMLCFGYSTRPLPSVNNSGTPQSRSS